MAQDFIGIVAICVIVVGVLLIGQGLGI